MSDADALGPDLSHAGAVVDKAIEHMVGQQIGSIAIASALLAGALGLLSRGMTDADMLRILERAGEGVRSGALRQAEASRGHDA